MGDQRTVPCGASRVLAEGLELFVEEDGVGPPVVLIPGWAYTTEVFGRNIPALAGRYHTVAYDPRSQGRSALTETGNDYLQHGRDLHQLLLSLDLPKVHLVGWSLGVYDALAYIEQFGHEKVLSLVMVDESPSIIKTETESWGEGSAEELKGLIEAAAGEDYLEFFREYMAQGFLGEPPVELLDRFTLHAATTPPSVASALLRDATRHDFRSLAGYISRQIPVMQIVRQDWSEAARAWVSSHQPEAEFHVLGGHLMLMEFSTQFNDLLLHFLDRHTRR